MRERLALFLWLLFPAAFGSWVAVMAADDQVPFEYISGQIKPDPVRQGGRVLLTWKIKPPVRVCPRSVTRTLRDELTGKIVASYDPLPFAITVAMGDTEIPKTFLLPEDMPSMVGYDEITCFRCNALQAFFPLCVKTPHVTFTVKEN